MYVDFIAGESKGMTDPFELAASIEDSILFDLSLSLQIASLSNRTVDEMWNSLILVIQHLSDTIFIPDTINEEL